MSQTQRITAFVLIPLLVISLGAVGVFNLLNTPKIAYVNIQKLLFDYAGMKEAKTQFDQQKQAMLANADTLRVQWEKSLKSYQDRRDSLVPAERQQIESKLAQQELRYQSYATTIGDKIEAEDADLMQGVLNQINSFIEKYAREEGYDIILGTDGTGTVLYGEEKLDITDDLLNAINKEYQGK